MPLGETPRYVLGYVCQRDDGKWKCGCSDQECGDEQWQMQALADVASPPVSQGSCMAPPTLSAPMVVQDTCPGNVDAKGGDLLVKMPNKVCTAQLNITNARNVHVIGGRIELGSQRRSAPSRLSSIKGHAHLEGMHIDVMNRAADGIRIYNSPDATLTVQNSLIKGPGGTHGGHPRRRHPHPGRRAAERVPGRERDRPDQLSGHLHPVPPAAARQHRRQADRHEEPLPGLRSADAVDAEPADAADPRQRHARANMYGMLDYTAPEGTVLSNVYVDASLRNLPYHTRVIGSAEARSRRVCYLRRRAQDPGQGLRRQAEPSARSLPSPRRLELRAVEVL